MNWLKWGVLVAVLPTFLALGCTNSDPINTGNVEYVINVNVTDPGSRYELARLQITQINVRPNDPVADEALGPAPIGVLVEASDILTVDLNNPADFEPANIVLSSGTYRISNLTIVNYLLVDQDPPPPTACNDLAVYLQPQTVPVNLTPADLGGDAFFTVPAEGAGTMQITIDAAAIIASFENTWDCVIPPGVATNFRVNEFKALSPLYIDIR